MTGPTLATTVAGLAAGLDTQVVMAGGSITWSRGETAFAVLHGSAVELRLDRAVAAAALRTPDTAPSPRGPEWVSFAPSTLEGHDLDRLEAWFGLAYRRAETAAPRT
ncbi:MAG TPA: hypothetical protein VKR30_07905 [Candidatus Limnocylindrales bacterium]|nr:hypothetical protein [Candidatus Limnocylindrales bacterium]